MIDDAHLRTVRRYLLSSEVADGAKLPTERAMSQALGLSRGVVRGALGVLESEGRIVRKVGSGTYLAPSGGPGTLTVSSVLDANPRQIMEARFAFEPYIAGIAAMNCNKQDLERLTECAVAYGRADNFDAFEAADEGFHAAIAAATHNPVVVRAYETFNAAHAAAEWGSLRERFLNAERRVSSRHEHDSILEAIRGRDSEAAIGAVQHHLKQIVGALIERR